jgi:hypothetical protein
MIDTKLTLNHNESNQNYPSQISLLQKDRVRKLKPMQSHLQGAVYEDSGRLKTLRASETRRISLNFTHLNEDKNKFQT